MKYLFLSFLGTFVMLTHAQACTLSYAAVGEVCAFAKGETTPFWCTSYTGYEVSFSREHFPVVIASECRDLSTCTESYQIRIGKPGNYTIWGTSLAIWKTGSEDPSC